jgi:hypothetical protein
MFLLTIGSVIFKITIVNLLGILLPCKKNVSIFIYYLPISYSGDCLSINNIFFQKFLLAF